MNILASVLLLVPFIIAGCFVDKNNPKLWIVAFAIALVFVALLCIAGIYIPALRL